jgi:hypothetical protein
MVLVKVKKDTYGHGTDYLMHALDYLYDHEKALHIGGYGVDPSDLQKTYRQMVFVKEYFHRTQDNPLIHFIVSFGDEVKTYKKAKALAVLIGAFFGGEYQLLWAVHQKKRGGSMFHIHFIMNSVSFIDGKLYNSSKKNIYDFCQYIERVSGYSCVYCFAGYGDKDDV